MVGITDSLDMSLSKLQKSVMDREPGMLQSMGSQRVRHDLATEHQCLVGRNSAVSPLSASSSLVLIPVLRGQLQKHLSVP